MILLALVGGVADDFAFDAALHPLAGLSLVGLQIKLGPLRARERPFVFKTEWITLQVPPVRISSFTGGSSMMPVSMPFNQ